jgi:thyroid adenoma-associated protein
MINRHV